MEPTPKRLLDQVRETIRLKHDSIRTENACVDWIRRFVSPTSCNAVVWQCAVHWIQDEWNCPASV